MNGYVLHLDEVDRTLTAVVGGKGTQLGELSRIDGVRVPPGFCVATSAFHRILADTASLDDVIDRLSRVRPDDHEAIRTLSAEARRVVEQATIPADVAAAITRALERLGGHTACAVRSSATTEDSATTSFAGQQDTYLNVRGADAILAHVSRCCASLFTERAVTYRMRNGIDHRSVGMAVVVQRMVSPRAAGVLFTAHPVTGHRSTTLIEAVYGLGEALVSGTASADSYSVRDGHVVASSIASKPALVVAAAAGGTESRAVDAELRDQPVLTDVQVRELARLGRRIEAHFGTPQDIEWCLDDDGFHVVQSRPITTLFPVPASADGERHVYVSVGHAQMMTDAMKPLGISMWQLTAGRPMHEAGARLFVDVTKELASPASRAMLLDVFGRADPLVRDALHTLIDRNDFLPPLAADDAEAPLPAEKPPLMDADPAIVEELIARTQASLAELKREIATKTGPALLDLIMADVPEMRRVLADPQSRQVIMAGMEAAWWLNDRVHEWLGEKNVVDALAQSLPHSVTSAMGLALLDVADVIRPYPDVVAFLQHVRSDAFLDDMASLAGGAAARDAIREWLETYGMRCPGEIDITRPRWSEHPTAIIPMILANVRDFEAGEAARRFRHGLDEAARRTHELLARLRTLPDGERKAENAQSMIERVRTFSGFREYPKYGMISRYFIYRQSLLQEAARLVRRGVLDDVDDVCWLTMQELHDVVRTQHADHELIRRRRDSFELFRTLTPPRVLTSDGEMLNGAWRRDDVPAGALTGLAVSPGIVEGRARVILDIADADLEPGDILVTRWTDPSWTPLFVAIGGLVTEVGGLMTHGAVIAREYGLPAVVAMPDATRLIGDGQRIRVNGTDGYVELVD